MWIYEKRLEFPVNVSVTNAKMAKAIMTQLGGLNIRKVYAFLYLILLLFFPLFNFFIIKSSVPI